MLTYAGLASGRWRRLVPLSLAVPARLMHLSAVVGSRLGTFEYLLALPVQKVQTCKRANTDAATPQLRCSQENLILEIQQDLRLDIARPPPRYTDAATPQP